MEGSRIPANRRKAGLVEERACLFLYTGMRRREHPERS